MQDPSLFKYRPITPLKRAYVEQPIVRKEVARFELRPKPTTP